MADEALRTQRDWIRLTAALCTLWDRASIAMRLRKPSESEKPLARFQHNEFLTTRELADLLRIKERKVYELAASGDIPVSRATGKLLFPRQAIEAWIARNSSGTQPEDEATRTPVFAGSHDPLLEWALRESRAGLATFFDGSLDGVERFAARQAIAIGVHISDFDGNWNTHLVAERFGSEQVVLVEFAWRDRGLVVAPGSEDRICNIHCLRGRRVVPRQSEAGSQTLLDHLLAAEGITKADIEPVTPARTELDAVLAVAQDKADVAFGLLSLARQLGLGFVPMMRERFDLLVDRHAWFEPDMQRFLDFCRTENFHWKASELSGYDTSGFGRVHFNGP
jgi:putative molybdopterin biosynthesis protein